MESPWTAQQRIGNETPPKYTREQLRKQIEVGFEYAHANKLSTESYNEQDDDAFIEFMTSHLWGTLGMILGNTTCNTYTCECEQCAEHNAMLESEEA